MFYSFLRARISAGFAIVGIIGTCVLLIFSKELLGLFSKESEREKMIDLSHDTMILMAVSFVPAMLQSTLMALYQGLGYMGQAFVIGTVSMVVSIFVQSSESGPSENVEHKPNSTSKLNQSTT